MPIKDSCVPISLSRAVWLLLRLVTDNKVHGVGGPDGVALRPHMDAFIIEVVVVNELPQCSWLNLFRAQCGPWDTLIWGASE